MSVTKAKQLSLISILTLFSACQTSPPMPSNLPKPSVKTLLGAGLQPVNFQGLAANYRLETVAGNGDPDFKDGSGDVAMFSYPWGLATDAQGHVYIAERYNHRIRKMTPTGQVSTLAGNREPSFQNGSAQQARFDNPLGVALDQWGQWIIADGGNHKIRLLTLSGQVSTLAGDKAGFLDGNASASQFKTPSAVAIDRHGSAYIADTDNHRIRRLSADGKTIETIAGTGVQGWKDGTALQSQFFSPRALAFDKDGNLYISDGFNHCIRKLGLDGRVSTIAGNRQAGFKDGIAAQAQFYEPHGLTVDMLGNLYIADTNNHRIRLLNTTGEVTTLSGGSPGYADGDLQNGRLKAPTGIALAAPHTIYVADSQNHRIRRLQ